MKKFLKENKLAIGGISVTMVLAFVAVFTALRLYSLRAPNAPESNPGATDLQCQNGDQNRDQNMWLICECPNGCTQKCDNSAGGGGCGWTCDQNCRLVPKGTNPQGTCTQTDYVHSGSSNYCGVANISCGSTCQGNPNGGSTPIPSPKGLCDDSCTQDSDCEVTAPTGAQLTCNKTIGKCVNRLCPNDTVVGNNCDCRTAVQQCGQPCGGGYPLCGAGSTCVYVNGPTCNASSTANPTTYCVPVPLPAGYSAAHCEVRDTGNAYLLQGTKTTFTAAQVAQLCNPVSTPTGTPISTPTGTPTGTPTATPTVVTAACTALTFTLVTQTGTPTATPTSTPTDTPTGTPTPTPTSTATATPTGTATATPTTTATATATPTGTATSTPTTQGTSTPIAQGTSTPGPQLPNAGIAWPTVLLVVLGMLMMGAAIFFAM